MTLGEKIINARKQMGMSQKELASQLGITATRLNYWEKDKRDPPIPMLNLLSETLKIDVDTLIGRERIESYPENKSSERENLIIQKYRALDEHGKKIVDIVLEEEYQHTIEAQKEAARQERARVNTVSYFYIPEYQEPASAGTGQPIGVAYPETIALIKEPPKGTSFIAHIRGDSMEPDFEDGDMVFVHMQNEIRVGQVGLFFMDGEEFIKELGEDELISRNPKYEPIEFDESIRCHGLVLGICDESYFFEEE